MSRANPSAATARPVSELSREISTGVSAPPTGRQMPAPRPRASTAEQEEPDQVGVGDRPRAQADDGDGGRGVHPLLAGEGDGPAGEQLLQLGEGDQAAGERRRPDHQAEDQLQDVQAARVARLDVQEGDHRDQGGGAARRPR